MPTGKVLRHWAAPEPDEVSAWWLLERAMALLTALMAEPSRKGLVYLPPEGATLLEVERAAIVAALEATRWMQNRAAKMLGITARVMNYKMKMHDLYREDAFVFSRRRARKRAFPGRFRTTT